ncbi:MAG: amidohydrolase [Chloroflexi bacterium]|nr:amidohydrolase [Chloroflexota bacterium]
MHPLMKDAFALRPRLVAWRRDFHQHPELGFQEHRSARIIAQHLRALGYQVQTGVAETGVVAVAEGSGPGPTVLLRFDMDALPIQEETGAAYASQNPGVMHACGHDGHMAIGLGVAQLLAARRDTWPGRVKFMFQPAEEGLGGAARMIEAGVLENPRPDYALGLHLWNGWPVGWVGYTPGPAMAGASMFRVVLQGRGGHGAIPHTTRDPVLAAGHVITALHTIVSRNVPAQEAGVLSVGAVHAGHAPNVIPETATLEGTLRAFQAETLRLLEQRVRTVAQSVSQAFEVQADVSFHDQVPPLINDPEVCARAQQAGARVWPEMNVLTDHRTMGSEDMALVLARVPGCYFFVGSANPDRGLNAPHHHPRFDFDDEDVLPRATALMTAAALEVLGGSP